MPDHLQPSTKAELRATMQKDPSPADKPGYLYAFEIKGTVKFCLMHIKLINRPFLLTDPQTPEEMHIKVGREKTLNERTAYWKKHYSSFVLRFPKHVLDRRSGPNADSGDLVPFATRAERLVHIELQDLVQHFAYLDPEFPKAKKAPAYSADWGRGRSSCVMPSCALFRLTVFGTPC
jgi:hypothetical protein